VVTDWHEVMVSQYIMQSAIANASGQQDPWMVQPADAPPIQSITPDSLIFHLTEGRMLSCREPQYGSNFLNVTCKHIEQA